MHFKPTKLPDRPWLKLFEATTYIALGEALDTDDVKRLGYPSTRVYEHAIEQAVELCLEEALSISMCSAFVKLFLPRTSSPLHPPSSSELAQCEASWPQSGKALREATVKWERAKAERKNSTSQVDEAQQNLDRCAAKLKQELHRCIEEAISDRPRCGAFLGLIIRKRPSIIPPFPEVLEECKASWPPTGQLLYELARKHQCAFDEAENRINDAEPKIEEALRSGRVAFNGERDGLREDIDIRNFGGAPVIDIYADIVEAFPGKLSSYAGQTLKWTSVHVEIASLMKWHRAAATTDRTETTATTDLAEQLKKDRHLLRDVAFAWVQKQGYKVSYRGFQYRIWPRAREQAGLSARAPSGPKPKSPR